MSIGDRRLHLILAFWGLAAAILFSVLRPLWRDEYWALWFSAPGIPLADLIPGRMARDVHPPLYFIALHGWRSLFDNDLFARALNWLFLAAAGFAAFALGRKRSVETGLFVALCATSYWAIYFGVEARMYALLFSLSALLVLVVREALDEDWRAWRLILFTALGACAGLSHYFGALCVACLGFWAGVFDLRAGRPGRFFAWGTASAIAIAPTAFWILILRPPGAESGDGAAVITALGKEAGFAANQFLRGLVVKTFGSNLPAFICACAAIPMLLRAKDRRDGVLLAAIATVVVAAFALHLFWRPLIKERAFIVIMPAVIYLIARGCLAIEQGWSRKLLALVPVFALASPLIFAAEHLKDREKLGEVRALLADRACAGAPVLAAYRISSQGEGFAAFMTARTLPGPRFIDAADAGPPPPASTCPVKAIATGLPKGEREMHGEARRLLTRAGLDLSTLEERPFGKGRTLVWLAR